VSPSLLNRHRRRRDVGMSGRRHIVLRERGGGEMILGLGFGLLNFYISRDQSESSIRSDGSGFSRVRPNAIPMPPTRNKFTLGPLSCPRFCSHAVHTIGLYHVKLNLNHIIFLYLLYFFSMHGHFSMSKKLF
jgi:hypothetical protein